ncbi:hypothetical protein TBR22_A32110 [Luteitalea sp. TBR-22]|uniref:hypothetical protein n=1 Tax=Luteitalea sp. TBR-22 TaxID=2802971 RepID=UPI001AFC63A5|nr:hypothetical protein [Luteitalea sp. TBR-22]BCS33982.1 hypothetical protein TBR22_A32110 [Luteitalea sp. TBR-22]
MRWVDEEGLDAYVRERLAQWDELRRRVGFTDLLGRILHWRRLGSLRQRIAAIGPRSRQLPEFGELELTFLLNPDWVEPIDRYLRVLHADLARRRLLPLYSHFEGQLARDAVPRLAELNLYGAVAGVLPVEAFPRIGVGNRRSDMAVQVEGRTVYIEVTVLQASRATMEELAAMRRLGLSYMSGSGRADADVGRLLGKVAHELGQVAPGQANMIVVLQDHPEAPFDEWYVQATNDGLSGDFEAMDPTHRDSLQHLDSIVLCGRRHVRAVCVNATAASTAALTLTQRRALVQAFRLPDVMMR